jgi:5-methylcytosine-specific restriction endonuclease McrA
VAAKELTPEQKAAKAERMRQWNAANKEHKNTYMRERYAVKRDHILANERARYLAKRAKILPALRELYAVNKEAAETKKASSRAYRTAHLEESRARARQWQKSNPEQTLANIHNRRALKRAAPGRHTAADVAMLYSTQRGLCAGCTAALVKTGKGKMHVDHVMPIKLGGGNGPENLQLLCPPCNLSKNAQHPDDWARSRGRLFA